MKYLKIFGQEWLEGSIRIDLDSAGRGVWADLLAMAQISRRVGYIERSEGLPYGDEELALRFKIPLELLQGVIAICRKEGRLGQLRDGTYFISNWNKYQDLELGSSPSDPEAIKKAKEKVGSRRTEKPNRAGKPTHKKCPECEYKRWTDETLCPKCLEKDKDVFLERDYKASKYDHIVRR